MTSSKQLIVCRTPRRYQCCGEVVPLAVSARTQLWRVVRIAHDNSAQLRNGQSAPWNHIEFMWFTKPSNGCWCTMKWTNRNWVFKWRCCLLRMRIAMCNVHIGTVASAQRSFVFHGWKSNMPMNMGEDNAQCDDRLIFATRKVMPLPPRCLFRHIIIVQWPASVENCFLCRKKQRKKANHIVLCHLRYTTFHSIVQSKMQLIIFVVVEIMSGRIRIGRLVPVASVGGEHGQSDAPAQCVQREKKNKNLLLACFTCWQLLYLNFRSTIFYGTP